MTSTELSFTILVDHTPKEASNAIHNVRGWWSGDIEGDTGKGNPDLL